jgi:hypothetical protein
VSNSKRVSHEIGKRVALHAWWIARGTLVAEERERKRMSERRERKNKEAMEIIMNSDDFEKGKKVLQRTVVGFCVNIYIRI